MSQKKVIKLKMEGPYSEEKNCTVGFIMIIYLMSRCCLISLISLNVFYILSLNVAIITITKCFRCVLVNVLSIEETYHFVAQFYNVVIDNCY